jgi:DeoR family suf operon transcriptional repressor
MQETRRYILDILKEQREATVEELVVRLRDLRHDNITAVTVRHHLNELLKENLITCPEMLHRNTPGRPRHVYSLTDSAREYFPNNYQPLASRLLIELSVQLPSRQVNVILQGVADQMASEADIPNIPMPQRLEKVVIYLNEHGYNASWEKHDEGYILSTCNCPYHHIAETSHTLCEMDMRLVSSLLGIVPRLMSRVSDGGAACTYMIPD